MKFTQRLDYSRLAEVLAERDMADVSAIQELLQASNEGGQPFPEALVTANMVSDWDLSRIVCEIFHLPFLPVDQSKPDKELLEIFHPQLLQSTGLVPISKYGNVLTIAMPGLVTAETLAMISAESDMVLLPIVGTVNSNRKWLAENCKVQQFAEDAGWGSLFDEGDAAVQEGLGDESEGGESLFSMEELNEAGLGDPDSGDTLDLEAAGLDFEEPDHTDLDDVPGLADASLDLEVLDDPIDIEADSGGSIDLPPMPDFNG